MLREYAYDMWDDDTRSRGGLSDTPILCTIIDCDAEGTSASFHAACTLVSSLSTLHLRAITEPCLARITEAMLVSSTRPK